MCSFTTPPPKFAFAYPKRVVVALLLGTSSSPFSLFCFFPLSTTVCFSRPTPNPFPSFLTSRGIYLQFFFFAGQHVSLNKFLPCFYLVVLLFFPHARNSLNNSQEIFCFLFLWFPSPPHSLSMKFSIVNRLSSRLFCFLPLFLGPASALLFADQCWLASF